MNIEISDEDSEYMYHIIQEIIEECGPRMPCSPQEAKGAEIVRKELEKTCDEVNVEPFTCHPRAALGYIRLDIILVIMSFSLFFIIQLFLDTFMALIFAFIIFGLNFLAFLIIWYEFFNYKEFVDPLFKEKPSQNVIGKFRADSEVKNIIIFSGHIDSQYQFNLLTYLKAGYGIVTLLGLGILFLWIGVSLIFLLVTILAFIIQFPLIYDLFFNIVIWFLIIGGIPLIALLFFTSPGEKANKVPGAVDNLSAIAVVLGLGRYLKNHKDVIPKNTEVRLIAFGCEEAFLRGAFRYVAAHLDELKGVNTEVINLEMFQGSNEIFIWNYEPTTRTHHSEELIQKVLKTAEILNIKAKISPMGGEGVIGKLLGKTSGGTDAAAFSKSNIKACTITSTGLLKASEYWHTPRDTFDKIEKGALENALTFCEGYIVNKSETH
ncbi:MAG: M28 family peptidase [Candidatus Lokiarchaeota archaeon]|nr:M28 family peptidase [Candidatus Lokiarchaeota archaeon]